MQYYNARNPEHVGRHSPQGHYGSFHVAGVDSNVDCKFHVSEK